MLVSLASKYPNIQGGVLERPEVAAISNINLENSVVGERTRVIQGNFLEEVPRGFDCIVMKHIMHDWPDEICLRILNNCRDALQVGDKIFIVDSVIEPNNEYYARNTMVDIII